MGLIFSFALLGIDVEPRNQNDGANVETGLGM